MRKMTYEEFKEYVKDHVIEYLPEEFQDATVNISQVPKTNRMMDCVMICAKHKDKGKHKYGISPSIYLEPMYQLYLECEDLSEAMRSISEQFLRYEMDFEDQTEVLEYVEEVLKNPNAFIHFRVVNYEMNEEMLKGIPHRKMLDLAITYHISLETKGIYGDIIIDHYLMNRLGFSEEQLFQIAYNSTRILTKPEVTDIRRMLLGMMKDEEIDSMSEGELTLVCEALGMCPQERNMYVLTNKERRYGASSFLYYDLLAELARKWNSDLYVLPSSVHEMVIVSTKDLDLDVVKEMNYEVTHSRENDIGEFLSDKVYRFFADERKLMIA